MVLAMIPSSQAQHLDSVHLDRINRRLSGHVIDYTNNHGSDRRVLSPILGMARDLYIYIPPGYDPRRSYPLVMFFHMANDDERYFIRSNLLPTLESLIASGEFPPAIVACPDGVYGDARPFHKEHSLFINGLHGRFEDHILQEVIPFLVANYTIRPEREAHAMLGVSGGAYGAMSMAIEHREFFGAVATLAGALNLRYYNADEVYFENFDPVTYRWKTRYVPGEIIGKLAYGTVRLPARRFMGSVFGEGDIVAVRIADTNPADKLFTTDIQPGQLAIYANYGGKDSFNFDAQVESFAWLAAGKGIDVTLDRDPRGTHSRRYLRGNVHHALVWLGQHLMPPTPEPLPASTGDP
jgi:S-formylglutathione hydrolase FrmB